MMAKQKKWWQSKTKVGALLIAVGPVLATVGGFLAGSVDFPTAVIDLSTQIGAVCAVFGVRDLPFINK